MFDFENLNRINNATYCFSFVVQCRIYGLIGCLAKDYPDCIENIVEDGVRIRDMYFKAMENAVINKQDVIPNE